MSIQLQPPTGLPTEASTAEEAAWSNLIASQLSDVRKTAENWRNGLIAIVTAIMAFSIIKGPNDISGLDPSVGYGVGVLVLLALIFGIIGAWSALTAAYGKPSVVTRDELRQRGGIDGYRLWLAVNATRKLRFAQFVTIVTLTFLAIAVGLTCYGPRPNSVTLEIDRPVLPSLCGKLLSSSNGQIDIKPPGSVAVRLSLSDVTKLAAKKKCDD